jgi:hypothetical protein
MASDGPVFCLPPEPAERTSTVGTLGPKKAPFPGASERRRK